MYMCVCVTSFCSLYRSFYVSVCKNSKFVGLVYIVHEPSPNFCLYIGQQ